MARWAQGWRVVTVNDASRVLPRADVLYACDEHWWDLHCGAPWFHGERWSSHNADADPKIDAAARHGIHLVDGRIASGFSFDPQFIHYGDNSGFQAINLALLFGAKRIVLVGFNMSHVGGRSHFFGDHPPGLRTIDDEHYKLLVAPFRTAALRLPADVQIINATRDSALDCFPKISLESALNLDQSLLSRPDDRMCRNRAISNTAAN